jgi:peptidoglycan/xylan/chitin deacetylase (PgdA/CDA1 family)
MMSMAEIFSKSNGCLISLSIIKTPTAARRLFPAALWKVRTRSKKLYLTFDDGPIPEATPQVLDELRKYNAKATFFCIGKNVAANPNLYQRIMAEGHLIGNHTYDQLSMAGRCKMRLTMRI